MPKPPDLNRIDKEKLASATPGESTPSTVAGKTKSDDDANPAREVVAEMEDFLGMGNGNVNLLTREQSTQQLEHSRDRPLPGISVPGYEVLAEIGRGGMGVVYRARDISIHRDVALKFLQDKYAPDSPAASRFLEEARITGQLQHPGIPAVHQIGKLADGRPFLAMKLIKGRTLDELLEDQSAAPRNWLAVFEAICQAVGYAHSHHVIHRDLKPANVMVGSFGEVQVMDWGLAKVLTAERTAVDPEPASTIATEIRTLRDNEFTQHGSVMGTLAYMPPEQAAGEIDRVDQRTDVFSLGAILCVILTGKPPYAGTCAEAVRLAAMRGKLDDAYARLEGSGAEPELVGLAKRCLAFEQADRPADGSAVASEVAQLRAGAEQRARQAELDRAKAEIQADEERKRSELERANAAMQAAEQRKRRKVQLALSASVLTLILLIGGGLWWADRQAAEKALLNSERDTERQIDAARNRQAIDKALDQAEAALRKENPVYGEIDSALAQVEHRLPTEGMDGARTRFENLKKDRRMLERLDEIDNRRWTPDEVNKDFDPSDSEIFSYADIWRANTKDAEICFPIAFRDYGIDCEAEPPANLSEKVRNSLIAPRLMIALVDWWGIAKDGRLLALIDQLDPDTDRTNLRSLYATGDERRIAESVAKLNGRVLPPAFAKFVGGHPLTPQKDAIRILTAAQAAQPNYFSLAMQTALRCPDEQGIIYYRVAVALRSENLTCHLRIAGQLARKKDLDGAIVELREAIRLAPNNANAHSNLGCYLSVKGEWIEAIAESRESVQLDPKSPFPHILIGHILRKQHDLDGAIAEFTEAIRLAPKISSGHNHLAGALWAKKDLDGAIAASREGIRLEPRHAYDHNNLGVFLVQKKDLDGAIAEYMEAIRLKPNYASAHSNLGIALREQKDLDGAIAAAKKAISLEPDEAVFHNNLGVSLREKKDFDGAIAACKEAIRLDPKAAEYHFSLGRILSKMNDQMGAIAEYKEAIRLEPENAMYYNYLGDKLHKNKDLDGAIAAYREAIRLEPKTVANHSNLGFVLRDKKDRDGAIAEFKEAIRLEPEAAGGHKNLGDVLREKRDWDGAIAEYEAAIKLDPNIAQAYKGLAEAHKAAGNADLTLLNQERAFKSFKKNSGPDHRDTLQSMNSLASAYLAAGKIDSALQLFDEAQSLWKPPSESTPKADHIFIAPVGCTWEYKGGSFKKFTETIWVESDVNSAFRLFFEVPGPSESIELYDKSRNMWIQLHRDKMTLKQPNAQKFVDFRSGKWTTKPPQELLSTPRENR